MVQFPKKPVYDMDDLVALLRILRAPGGCPWDRVQTHLSNRRNFLEEAYEAAEAFDRDDPALMCEELGDMLMQVLFNIHIEEDAGKLIHRGDETLIDYNRAGVPLIEIVSEPDMRTPEEAKAYLNSLRRILSYLGVSDCRMNEGSLRCDVNISVRQRGDPQLGVKCEIKNVNSVNYVGRALEEEILRQTALLEAGEVVEPETRRFNEDTGKTERMRKKETLVDYRYFTEPNLPAIVLTDEYMDMVKRQMPQMPDEAAAELTRKYGVKPENAVLLTSSVWLTDYFTRCAEATPYRAACENLFIGEVLEKLGESTEEYIAPENFAQICALFGEGKIVSSNAKRLVHLTAESGEDPVEIAGRENMLKITDRAELEPIVTAALSQSEKAIADYRRGKKAAAKQILGQVMRLSGGRADPAMAEEMILTAIDG